MAEGERLYQLARSHHDWAGTAPYSRAVPALSSLEPAFGLLAAEPGALAWLDAGPEASAGSSYLLLPAAEAELLTASVSTGRAELHRGSQLLDSASQVWTLLERHWIVAPESSESIRFVGGWVGWLGFETGGACLELDLAAEPGLTDAAWFRAGAWARLDHASGELELAGSDPTSLRRLKAALEAQNAPAWHEPAPPAHQPEGETHTARWRDQASDYAAAVREAQRLIYEGEAYQLCLTSRVSGRELGHSPQELYVRLRHASSSHHGSFVRIGDTTVFGSSPETFLDISPSGTIRSKPIKGTRPRGSDPQSDAALRNELESSEKERAENIMIVDLMRNDIGRVSVPGSVRVSDLLAVESYRPVHQLVSTVAGQLKPGLTALEAIASAFPAGSMTGAPKRRAVEHLARLERGPRGIYSGALGYLSDNGAVDLAMIIRSVVITPAGWSIGAGGGITALSEPDAEVAEARLKAAALLAVLGVRAS